MKAAIVLIDMSDKLKLLIETWRTEGFDDCVINLAISTSYVKNII